MKRPKKPKDWKKYISLPKIINIGYQDIKVSEVDAIDDTQGSYSSSNSQIKIRKDLDEREILNTLLHEALHAICYIYGLKAEFDDDDHEEKLINSIGNGLTELFVRNPEVVKIIGELV